MPKIISIQDIKKYRIIKWRLESARRIKTSIQAGRFIEDMGFCLLFGCADIPLPKLSESAQSTDWAWWEWKNTLQANKKCYSSRVVRGKATLISMELLPCFLSLYYAEGGCEVYEEEYYYGRLTERAYHIADYLYRYGPSSIDELRKKLALPGKSGTRQFHSAINELQLKFKIAVSGLVDKNWGMRILDLFSHWAPVDILSKSELISPHQARILIIHKFIICNGMTDELEIRRLFGWSLESIQPIVGYLIEDKKILKIIIRGKTGEKLIPKEIMEGN